MLTVNDMLHLGLPLVFLRDIFLGRYFLNLHINDVVAKLPVDHLLYAVVVKIHKVLNNVTDGMDFQRVPEEIQAFSPLNLSLPTYKSGALPFTDDGAVTRLTKPVCRRSPI